MATGHVKLFHADRKFGFVVDEEGLDVYVHADQVQGGELAAGDRVEFEVTEDENGKRSATAVARTAEASSFHPVGRTLAAPPTWEVLEERDRARRASRRRRR